MSNEGWKASAQHFAGKSITVRLVTRKDAIGGEAQLYATSNEVSIPESVPQEMINPVLAGMLSETSYIKHDVSVRESDHNFPRITRSLVRIMTDAKAFDAYPNAGNLYRSMFEYLDNKKSTAKTEKLSPTDRILIEIIRSSYPEGVVTGASKTKDPLTIQWMKDNDAFVKSLVDQCKRSTAASQFIALANELVSRLPRSPDRGDIGVLKRKVSRVQEALIEVIRKAGKARVEHNKNKGDTAKAKEEYLKLVKKSSAIADDLEKRKRELTKASQSMADLDAGPGMDMFTPRFSGISETDIKQPDVKQGTIDDLIPFLIRLMEDRQQTEVGSINPAMLPQYYNPDVLFQDYNRIKPKPTRIIIGVDSSSSMGSVRGGDKPNEVGNSATIVMSTINKICVIADKLKSDYGYDVLTHVIAFSTSIEVIKDKDEAYNKTSMYKKYADNSGGTDLDLLIDAIEDVPAESNTRDVVIILTDGRVGSPAKRRLSHCVATNRDWVVLSVRSSYRDDVFANNISSIQEAESILVEAIQKGLGK